MTYAKDSGLVKVWVSLVLSGAYTVEYLPALFNLKTVVTEIINSAVD